MSSTEEVAGLAGAPAGTPQRAFPLLRRTFQHRNYRIFFCGQVVSLMGTWMQQVAMAWLVYRLTQSTVLLGFTTFCATASVFFIVPFGGMIADRVDRRRMLLFTQGASLIQATLLAVLTLTGQVEVWHLIVLALLLGLIDGVDVPTRNAMTLDMVPKEDLQGAIALNSIMFNTARILGPSVATLVIALAGEGACFAINAVSFAAVLFSLSRMHTPQKQARPAQHPLREILEGYRYSLSNPAIRAPLLLVAIASMFGMSYFSLMPAVVREVLDGSTADYGLLAASTGLGALTGAYFLSHISQSWLKRLPAIGSLGGGLCLVAFSQSPWLATSLLFLMPASAAMTLVGGAANTIVQNEAATAFRGRVISHYAQCFLGMAPWGAILLGTLASYTGVAASIALGGLIVTLSGLAAILTRANRQ